MKHLITTLLILFSLSVSAQTTVVTGPKKQQITTASPKSKVSASRSKNTNSKKPRTGITNGHEWIDLSLPSGTLWATCNIGASRPEEYGYYFAWGEKNEYKNDNSNISWNTYFDTSDEGHTFKKYNINGGKPQITSEDDAACVNWGVGWRVPSAEQLTELLNNCTWTRTTLNGTWGYIVKSKKNGAHLFLPAAGGIFSQGLSRNIGYGYYWSRSLNMSYPHNAYRVVFNSDGAGMDGTCSRFCGLSVRPVRQ